MGGMVPVFNPGRVPALLDSEGRTLGGGSWGEADPDDPQTAHALAQGIIIEVQAPPTGDTPAEADAPAAADPEDSGSQVRITKGVK